MSRTLSYRAHMRQLLLLGLPLIGSHVAQFAITLSDGVMLGWYGVDALAAEVLGGTMFFVFFIVGSGFAWAVMPMVASAQARGDETQVRRVTRMGAWASVLYALAVLPAMIWSAPILRALGQDPQIVELAAQYLRIAGLAIVPALLVMVLKSYLSALERTQVVLWVTLGAVALNIAVNYLLIFGNHGFPELGVQGAALASLIVNLASLAALVVYALRVLPEHALLRRVWRPDAEALRDVMRLGWPIGVTNLAEIGLFAASSVMMGWLGTLPLAAHGIALQVTAVTFMVHVGLSNAATVRAGQAFGRGDKPNLRAAARVAVALSLGFALLTAFLYLSVPAPLIGAFMSPSEPDRAAVIAIGVGFLAAGAIFQLFDAAQIMALGLLRGMHDARVPMVIAAISYWGIGIPVAYVLCFTLGWGGIGIWIGLALGLAVAGVLLMLRFWRWSARWTPAFSAAPGAAPARPAISPAGP